VVQEVEQRLPIRRADAAVSERREERRLPPPSGDFAMSAVATAAAVRPCVVAEFL